MSLSLEYFPANSRRKFSPFQICIFIFGPAGIDDSSLRSNYPIRKFCGKQHQQQIGIMETNRSANWPTSIAFACSVIRIANGAYSRKEAKKLMEEKNWSNLFGKLSAYLFCLLLPGFMLQMGCINKQVYYITLKRVWGKKWTQIKFE